MAEEKSKENTAVENSVSNFERAIHSIEWNHESIPFSTFVDKHQLPQIVQVDDGYYGDDDEGSLSTGQILKIHCLKTTKKVVARDWYGNEVHIPLNTHNRVQLKPTNYMTTYRSVACLAQAKPMPKYVEASQGYYNVASDSATELSIEPGDRLEVISVDTAGFLQSKKKSHGWIKFLNSSGVEVKLPFDCTAGFSPLVDAENHYLAQVLSAANLPIYVKFVNENKTSTAEVTLEQQLVRNEFAKLGVLKLECVYDEELVIASCGENDVRVIFTIPKSLQITVRTALGCLKGDPTYVDLCRGYNDFVDLERKAVTRHDSEVFLSGRSKVKGYRYVRELSVKKHQSSDRKSSLPRKGSTFDEDFGDASEITDNNERLEQEQAYNRRKLSGQFGLVTSIQDLPPPYSGNTSHADNPTLLTVQEDTDNVTPSFYEEIDDESVYPFLFGKNRRSLTTSEIDSKRRSGSFTEGVTLPIKPLQRETSADNPDFIIPEDLSELDIEGVCKCLRKLNLAKFEEEFRFNQIDGSLLLALDNESLSDLGCGTFQRKKLMNFIGGWRPQSPTNPSSEK